MLEGRSKMDSRMCLNLRVVHLFSIVTIDLLGKGKKKVGKNQLPSPFSRSSLLLAILKRLV